MRTDSLLRQTRLRVPAFSAGRIEIKPIEKGGSDRMFYRIRCSPEQSLILVKYNLAREENRHYVRIAQFLAQHEIHVPRIYFHDADEGLIWIEDLGDTDLFDFRDEPWLVRAAFYRSAIDEIVRLHALPPRGWTSLLSEMPPEFNAGLYRWEQRYFFENCLGRIFQVAGKTIESLASLAALAKIAERLAKLPRILVHRDFQSQNIILRNAQAYLIDFQGMRPGLAQYDLASLLFDPYARLERSERTELCSYYLERRQLSAKSSSFHEILRLCAMQRLMQALGFFSSAKAKRHFLTHIPAALASLREIVSEMKTLAPLGAALASLDGNVLRSG